MPSNRSKLLGRQLPADLAELLIRQGLREESAWLRAVTDLNLSGSYEQIFLLVFQDRLITVGRPRDSRDSPIRIEVAREHIKDFRTRQGVGGGFLEMLADGVYVEVLAYSNATADTFAKALEKLKHWAAGEEVAVTAEDDFNARKCPECGMTLLFSSDICRRCVDRGAVFARVLKLMRPYRGRAFLMMSLVLLNIGVHLIPQQLVRLLLDKVLLPEKAGNLVLPYAEATMWLLGLVGALLATHLVGATISGFNGRLASFVGTQITYDMRSRVFNHLTDLSVAYYDRHSVGQLMNRVASDTAHMKDFIHHLTSGFLAQLIQIMVVGAVLFTLSWKLAIYTLLPAPLVFLAAMFFWKRVYPRYYRVWDAGSKLHGTLNSILSGIRVVKAFGQEKREQGRFGKSSRYIRDSARNVEYVVTAFNPAIGVLFQLGGLIVWFAGGRQVLAGNLSVGTLMAFLGYLAMFYNPLTHMTQLTNWLTGFLTASQRTFEILDTAPQIVVPAKPRKLPRASGAVQFEDVTFGYNRYCPIIKNVSLEIQPGEHIGIVGKSGSGKTTLVNLVARFYDTDTGRIAIDGADVRELDMHDLRRSIGVVLQEPFLFRGTIYSNITYGQRDVTPEQVMAAAKAANAHDFIMRQPLGYDTYIGERGAGLSGGERQRVSIARALLYDPTILILDEATSNVDTESERLIQQALMRVTAGRTTIAIAHRLSTLKNSDRIFVVDGGRIVESGTHEELMKLGGLYYRLVKIQTELSREDTVDGLISRK